MHQSQSVRDLQKAARKTSTVTLETQPESDTSSATTSDSDEDDEFCPFRKYGRLARNAPPGTITICSLAKTLKPLGVSHSDIGACFFELDLRDVGYVTAEAFHKSAVDVITRVTGLDKEEVEEAVASLP